MTPKGEYRKYELRICVEQMPTHVLRPRDLAGDDLHPSTADTRD
jgi:hypothetical protein